MLICATCHSARQDRDHQEHQPLQFTGYETTISRAADCPDCDNRSGGSRYEYLTAYELLQELEQTQERVEELEARPDWTVPGFYDAEEMLHAVTLGNQAELLRDPEVMLQVLKYATRGN